MEAQRNQHSVFLMPNLIKRQVKIDLQGQDERKEQLVVVVVSNLGYISVAVVSAIDSLATRGDWSG